MSKLNFVVLCLVSITCLGGLSSAFAKTNYEIAIRQLKADSTQSAVGLLETDIAAAPSALAYANLSLAYYQLGHQADAAWAIESSRALGSRLNDEALYRAIFQNIPAELQPLEAVGPRQAWRQLANVFAGHLWAGLGVLFVIGASGLGIYHTLSRTSSNWNSIPIFAAVLCLLIGVAALALAYEKHSNQNVNLAVVASPTPLLTAPSVLSDTVRVLPAGVVLPFTEQLGDTWAVELPTGEQGWVASKQLRRVLAKARSSE